MTLAPPDNQGPAGVPAGPGTDGSAASSDPAIRPVVRQRQVKRQRSRRRKQVLGVQAALTALFVVALVALSLIGWRSAMRITGGSATVVTDPAAPGYIAPAKPTDVLLIAFEGEPTEEGPQLATMLLVIEAADVTTLVPVPSMTTLWEFEGAEPQSAAAVFASGGIDVLRLRLGAELTFGATEAVTVPVGLIEDLVAAAGPITVALPDDVLSGSSAEDATVRYPAGPLVLEPGQVGEFMSFQGFGESEPNRALRLELAWEALAGGLAASPSDALVADGEDQERVAEVFDAIDGDVRFDLVPMTGLALFQDPPAMIYLVDEEAMPAWVAAEVPFPVSAFPGQRARVELLNGTPDAGALQSVAPEIVSAGGEITFTGNAESFDVATSRVEYTSPDARSAADEIAAGLGVSATRSEDSVAEVDVVVVVGTDRSEQG
jgi:hypothetical protein